MSAAQALHSHQLSTPSDVRWMHLLANALLCTLAVGAMVSAGVWIAHRPYFALQSVHIAGDVERTHQAAIRANVVSGLQGNFFTIDLKKAQAAFETVPWVRKAGLRRVWPNRLEVHLEEHRPAALWFLEGSRETNHMVNTFGEVFEVSPGDIEDIALPVLVGIPGSSQSMLLMLQSLSTLLAPLDSAVQKISLSSRGSWHVTLASGVTLELGRGTHAEVSERAAEFVATLPDVIQRYGRPLMAADLRHRGGYVVRLKGVSTTLDVNTKDKRK